MDSGALTVDELASRLGDTDYLIETLRRQLRASSEPRKFLTDVLQQLSDRILAVEVAEKLGAEIPLKDAVAIANESGNACVRLDSILSSRECVE